MRIRHLPIGRLLIVVQALMAIAFLALIFRGDHVRLPFSGGREAVEVVFADAAGIRSENANPVLIAGVRVGEVEDVAYSDGQAVVTLGVDDDARDRLRADASAEIVPRSALNDLTVELSPGTAEQPLEDNRVIPSDRSVAPVALDRVLETLDADTRSQIQILLGELSIGLRDRSTPLRHALGRLGPAVEHTERVASALASRRRLLTQLVGDIDTIFTTLGERGNRLAEAVSAGRATLDVTAARDRELSAVVASLPSTLTTLQAAMAEVRRLEGPLVPALADLEPAAERLPAATDALRAFVPDGDRLVEALGSLVERGRRPAAGARRALTALGPAAVGLEPSLRDLRPVLGDVDKNKDGIGLLGERFSGVFSTADANGPILRGLGFFEPFNPANFGMPGATGARLRALKLDVVRALTKVCREQNEAACLARYLVPGLPGAVRTAYEPLGSPRLSSRLPDGQAG